MKWFPFGKKKKTVPTGLVVLNVTDSSFETQVIKRSFKQPVMVDFWAAWCGPCRQLGPILERLAEDPDSEWMLAKLDTEHNQRMAARYQIRSIPAVKMFRNGRIVGEFTGVMPEPMVRQFAAQSIEKPALIQGFKGGEDPAQRLRLAQHQLKKGNGFEAYALLKDFPESAEKDTAVQLFSLAKFMCDMEDGDGLTSVEALDEHYLAANKALIRRKPGQALDHLLAALDVGEEMDGRYTTDIIESLFALLGENHKLTKTYRAKLS
ncbi:MAG: hypothetical protein GY796_15370 [Chloroflexi bacterium]|nr:hypothetical protein [Chloroflexota bacterium]